MKKKQKAIVVGAGISGMSIACLLAKNNFDVTVVEKNSIYGGRGRVLRANDFVFDMGPSWYLLPEVFDDFFKLFGEDINEYLELVKLDPSYRVFLPKGKVVDISTDIEENIKIFESIEPGSGENFKKYLAKSEKLYKVLVGKLFYKDLTSRKVLMDRSLLKEFKGLSASDLFSSYERLCSKYFKTEELKRIIQYGVALLGSHPEDAPGLYAMMSYADYKQGVFYPKGGIGKLFTAIYKLSKKLGVEYKFNFDVTSFNFSENTINRVISTDGAEEIADLVIMNGDYAFAELEILDEKHRTYDEKYWSNKKIGASAFIIYLGVNKKLKNLEHHNLFLDRDWKEHFKGLSNTNVWPEKPAYYVCAPSKTDTSVAPLNCENLFFTVPIPAGVEDNDSMRIKYFDKIIKHFESVIGEEIKYDIIYKKIFTVNDFIHDFHAYKGTALGLANNLKQTGFLRVGYESKKVKNLYYTGQYVHPGSGLSACVASARILSDKITTEYNEK